MNLRSLIAQPAFAALWGVRRVMFDAEYNKFVDDLLQEPEQVSFEAIYDPLGAQGGERD